MTEHKRVPSRRSVEAFRSELIHEETFNSSVWAAHIGRSLRILTVKLCHSLAIIVRAECSKSTRLDQVRVLGTSPLGRSLIVVSERQVLGSGRRIPQASIGSPHGAQA